VLAETAKKRQNGQYRVSLGGRPSARDFPQSEGVDVQRVRINPFGLVMDGKPEKVVEVIRKMHQAGSLRAAAA
jgi:hypothetical protein